MKIERSFDLRDASHVGDATLELPDGDWKLNGKTLPDISRDRLVRYCFQCLQDSYAMEAGAELDARKDAFTKCTDNLIAGTYRARSGEGMSTLDREMAR